MSRWPLRIFSSPLTQPAVSTQARQDVASLCALGALLLTSACAPTQARGPELTPVYRDPLPLSAEPIEVTHSQLQETAETQEESPALETQTPPPESAETEADSPETEAEPGEAIAPAAEPSPDPQG